jgi:exonuclease III
MTRAARATAVVVALLLSAFGAIAVAPAAPAATVDGTLTLTTATPHVGDTLTVHYQVPSGEVDPTNWVALYDRPADGPVNQTYSGHGSTLYHYVGDTGGDVTFTTTGLQPGTKTLYLLAKDGYSWLALPVAFTLLPADAPTVAGSLRQSSPADPTLGDTVSFSYTVPAAQVDATNWVGIYDDPASGPIDQQFVASSTTYQYVGDTGGTVSFSTSGLTPGAKVAYLLSKDGYDWLANPVSFFVQPNGAVVTPTDDGTLTLLTKNPVAGDPITFSYETTTPDPLNWVGLYDDPTGGPVDQVYPGVGSTTYEYVSGTSGTVTLSTAALDPGPHIAYFLYQDQYRWLAEPVVFTLGTPTPPPPVVVPHFVTDDFLGTPTATGRGFTQPLAGLWIDPDDGKPSYRKVSGDSWLTVSKAGVVSGTAPKQAGKHPALITVQATGSGGRTAEVTVEVPVYAGVTPPQLKTATWNLWDAGTHVDNPLEKELYAVLTNNLDVIGLQETKGTAAKQLAAALGWSVHQTGGDTAIISRYPITLATDVKAANATAVTTLVGVQPVRVWTADLSDASYGPDLACTPGATAASVAAAEKKTVRYQQATALVKAMKTDLSISRYVPVVLLGDLSSPSGKDWTKATAATHCGLGPVSWPVTDAITAAGLTDTFRALNPNPKTAPGNTFSPLNPTATQARVDYVDAAGRSLKGVESHPLVVGFPAPLPDVTGNSWTSDHAAVVTTFAVAKLSRH